jgi:hypothetical protein
MRTADDENRDEDGGRHFADLSSKRPTEILRCRSRSVRARGLAAIVPVNAYLV